MTSKYSRWSKVLGLALALWWALSPGLASSAQQASVTVQAAEPIYIRLVNATFDPLKGSPALPDDLAYSADEAKDATAYIVQLSGPVRPEWKEAITAAGGVVGGYLPDYAFLVRLAGTAQAQVAALPFVRWIGLYQPAYKLAADVDYADTRSYRVILAPWAEVAAAQAAIASRGIPSEAQVESLSAVLDGAGIKQLARLADVIWIEPYHLQRTSNDVAAGAIMGGTTAWGNGFTGTGVTIAVADTGLDTGNVGSIHQDFAGRVAQISSWPVQNINWGGGCTPTNAGSDDGAADKDSGHGTHVTGSVAGSGARSGGQYKGLGYQATITFQAVEQYTTWSVPCTLSNDYYLTGIPDDVRTLLSQAYNWGARIHNDSWGGGYAGVYDEQSAYFDDFIANHRDMTVVVANGNDGVDANRDGYVDENSTSSPATAKNVISIGASENERSSGGYQYTYGQAWPSDYPAAPTSNDPMSNSREHLAAFSSRGPLNDGRIKPDVVAPGTNILSVRSSQATYQGWGTPLNQYYMYMGGTSMASPLTAGAATVVRDFYIHSQGATNPSAALIKATLINTAVDIQGYGNASREAGQPIPNNHEGWGRVNVAAATTAASRQFADNTAGLNTGGTATYTYDVSTGKAFKASLVWSDPAGSPSAAKALVNDLNLRVTAPNGTTYWGNRFSGGWSQAGGSADNTNNVENVYVQSPATGQWKVEIIGQNVPQGPQPFALVVDGNISTTPQLTVTGINPASAPNNAVLNNAVISGTGFGSSSTVALVRGALSISGSSLSVNAEGTRITASFNLNGATPGLWGVRVTNPAKSVTLDGAFTVIDASNADLAVSKVASRSVVQAGSQVTFTISLRNYGYATATGIVFTDTLPAGLAFVSLSPACAGGIVNLADGFACNVPGSLISGAQVAYTLVAALPADATGAFTNRVVASRNQPDSNTANNSSQATIWVGPVKHFLPLILRTPSAPQNALKNGDFESGRDGSWTETPSILSIIVNSFGAGVSAHGGSYAAWLGRFPGDTSISQQVTMPSGSPQLKFWYWIAASGSCGSDKAYVMAGSTILQTYDLCSGSQTGGWTQGTIDMSGYAGQSTNLGFKTQISGLSTNSFYVDDVSCGS